MQNKRFSTNFKYNNFSGRINCTRNEKGKWFVTEEIPVDGYFPNGFNKYLVLIKGIQNEFDNQEEAIKRVELYLRDLINNGHINQFMAKNYNK